MWFVRDSNKFFLPFPYSLFKLLTTIDEDGYPCYICRDKGIFILKNGIKFDNRNVVPYSPLLLLRYQAHVNT